MTPPLCRNMTVENVDEDYASRQILRYFLSHPVVVRVIRLGIGNHEVCTNIHLVTMTIFWVEDAGVSIVQTFT